MITTAPESGQAHEAYKQIAEAINLETFNLSGNMDWRQLLLTIGVDTACASGTSNVRRVYIPNVVEVTGVQYLIGSVGGTDKVIAALYDSTGALLRVSAVAGATVGTAATIQQVPFALDGAGAAATTITLESGFYWIGLTFNGTTAKLRTVPTLSNVGTSLLGNGGLTQTFGTPIAITPPTTFTASKVPYTSTY
jgi:hypothetical protein